MRALLPFVLLASSIATAATFPESKGVGFAIGPLVPIGDLAEANDLGILASVRGFYFPDDSRHGVRAALWLAGTHGKGGVADGFGWGGEMDYAARFGRGPGPFYLFVGAGFGGSQFTTIHGSFPGGVQVKVVGTAGFAEIGVGYRWTRVYLESAYVRNFDDQSNYAFIPLTVGFQF